jgi:hypothetical protein
MRRRHVLGGLGAAATGALGWRPAWARTASGASGPAARLLGVLSRSDSAAVIGRAYLAGHPDEAEVDRLVAALDTALQHHHDSSGRVEGMELKGALSRLIRDDFAERRVVHVEGWVLSRSEARLCALAALA